MQAQGLWSIHLAVLLFGGTAQFARWIELPAIDITPLRSLFAALALLGYVVVRRQGLLLERAIDYALALLLGCLLALHWVTYFHAMQVAGIALGVIALYTYPLITVLIEPLLAGARPARVDIFIGLLVLYAIYLMTPEFSWANQTTQGIFWGVVSAFLFALRNVLQKGYFSRYPAQRSMLYQALIVVLVLLPWLTVEPSSIEAFQWWQLLLLGIVFTALPHSLFVHGLKFQKAKTASLIACLQVVYSVLLGWLLFDQWPQATVLIGGLIIVSVAVYESYFARRAGY